MARQPLPSGHPLPSSASDGINLFRDPPPTTPQSLWYTWVETCFRHLANELDQRRTGERVQIALAAAQQEQRAPWQTVMMYGVLIPLSASATVGLAALIWRHIFAK